jgi:hypothetical protein
VPHIIVMADSATDRSDGTLTLRERITSSDLRSPHFSKQLLERLTWAVEDAHDVPPSDPEPEHHEPADPEPDERQAQRSARVLTTAS